MSDREPIPDELAALFDAERSAPASDSQSREQVRLRLAAIVPMLPGKAAAGTVASTALLGGTGKIIAIVAIGISVGAAVVGIARHSEPSSSTPPAPVVRVEIEHVDPEPARDHAVQRDEVAQEPVLPTAPPAEHVATEAPPSEARLIKRAWSALSSGDAQQALDLTNDAERLHPDGVLIEEREALRIRAFSKLGQVAEAESAAKKFLIQFPRSVHRASVERVIKADQP